MEIKREDHAWGVSLTVRPFAALGNAAMQIGADITPRPNRNPDIRVQFTGALPPNTIGLSDAAIWVNGLNEIVEQAKAVCAELKKKTPPDGRAQPKRMTKKRKR